MRSRAGDVAVEYNVIATGIALVAALAMLGAANLISKVIFKDVVITLGQGSYSASYASGAPAVADPGDADTATSASTGTDGSDSGTQESSTTSSTASTGTQTCRSASQAC